jgi:hypothetical protein
MLLTCLYAWSTRRWGRDRIWGFGNLHLNSLVLQWASMINELSMYIKARTGCSKI